MTARLLAHLVLCTALLALLPGADQGVDVAVDDCCAGERASEPHDSDEDHSSQCPPGCDEGCACCASVSALPSVPVMGFALISPVVVETRRAEYEHRVERAPRAPEPRDRDAVPRAAV